jgi:hypothetical protein
MGVSRTKVPPALARLERRFATWRKSRSVGERIPEPLWKAAVQFASAHGLNQTASVLSLDYYSLKKRVDESGTSSATFVELPSPSFSIANECVIEMEDCRGARMRVQLKGQNVPDLLSLSRLFWDSE